MFLFLKEEVYYSFILFQTHSVLHCKFSYLITNLVKVLLIDFPYKENSIYFYRYEILFCNQFENSNISLSCLFQRNFQIHYYTKFQLFHFVLCYMKNTTILLKNFSDATKKYFIEKILLVQASIFNVLLSQPHLKKQYHLDTMLNIIFYTAGNHFFMQKVYFIIYKT